MNQLSFSDVEFGAKRKQTRREKFLSEMDQVIPWSRLMALIEPGYPKSKGERPPHALQIMLRIHFMQQWFSLNPFWRGATHFYHADTLSHWRKRKNLPHNVASVDAASIQTLANSIRTYFHHTEGRGNNCVVEPFRRGDLDYFFAYPEDYSQQSPEWVNGQFGIRPHNPAFEVIFVYSQAEGSLDLRL